MICRTRSTLLLRCARLLSVIVAVACAGAEALGGSYSQNFNAAAVGGMSLGDSTVVSAGAGTITTYVQQIAAGNNALQMMTAGWAGNAASWKINDLDVGKEIQSFDANFSLAMNKSGTGPGAGWSLNFGAIPGGNGGGEGGFVMPGGIAIAWDLFNSGGSDVPSIEVFCNGTSVGNFPATGLNDAPPNGGTFSLTNPTGGGTTAAIAYTASAATVQTAMRAVSGWSAVVVTGGAGGPWSVDRGAAGAYAEPTGNAANLLPEGSSVLVANVQQGAAGVNELWTVSPRGTFAFDTTFRPVAIHWDYNGLDVTFNGTTIFTDLPTPGFVPAAGNKFAFSVRAESTGFDMLLDDVMLATAQIAPLETGGPVITEFMADNAGGIEDEETDASDWIEIYNGQNASVNLSGYRLTNAAGNLAMWTLPSVTVPAYGYKIVWASGKNRTIATGQLHTNFTLQKEGGYLALVRPNATIATEFTYGAQYKDVSYGEKGPLRTLGYLQPASPGAKTNYSDPQAPQGPAEDVLWSRDGGIITGPTPVTIAAPLAPGAVVRYTTNNTEPGAASAIYNPASPPSAFTVTAANNLRARVYTPNMLPGSVSSRTFLLIDSTLTNYNGSGQVFNSHLPVIVLESFGTPVDSYTDATNRPYRFTYAVVIDKDPISGRASLTSPTVDFQGRGGTHVRGSSSAGFPQRQYAWETWDNSGNDKDASVLGMPAESDWIIYAPYDDKVLFRNHLIYTRMRQLTGGDGFGMRTKLCEVFFNQEAGQPVSASDYRGVYVLMEKIKIGKDRVDVEKLNALTTDATAITGGYIMKHDRVNVGDTVITTPGGIAIGSVDPDSWNSAQNSYLTTYLTSFETALNGANFGDPVLGYQAYIDRDTFIYNQWFIEIAKQIDGYRLSQYFWKDRGGKIRNGPIWDYNLSLSNADYLNGYVPTGWYYAEPDIIGSAANYPWYPRLHQHTTGADPYELRHWDLYWELRRGLFATAAIMAEIDAEAATLLNGDSTPITNSMAAQPPAVENAVRRHFRKWPILGVYTWPNAPGYASRIYFNSNGNATTGEVDFMKDWLTQRLTWIDNQNLAGTVIYRPPNFSQYGGSVGAGYALAITAYTGTPPGGFTNATGTLYYTLDGTDPRSAANTPAGTATAYTVPVVLNTSKTVKARLYNSGAAKWSPLTTGNFIVDAVPATAANLLISELHYNPAGPTAAELTAGYNSGNDFEFIELLNVSAQTVDLTNCEFTAGILFDFANADPATLALAPGGRVIVVGNKNAFLFRNGSNPAVKIAGEFTSNLSNAGELVTLLAASGATIASFTYGGAEPWPVDADGPGYSLVLNNPAAGLDYGSGANWRSSGALGGTAGLANSTPFAGSPTGDTDGDGVSDFFEYATGSNIGSAASRSVPVTTIAPFTVATVTQNYLKLDYRRNLAADGVQYTIRYSTDLTTWLSDPSAVTYVGTHNNGDGTATVTHRSTQPADAAHPRMFLRLTVTP